MNTNDVVRTSIAVLASVALAATASTALAQDVTESERATSDDLMDEAAERLEEEAELEDEREVESGLDEESDLSREEYEDEQRELSAEELDRLQRELQEKNREMIDQLDEIIESSPQDPQRPEWMFQKAERMWELRNMEYIRSRNQYNSCMDAVYEGTREEDQCEEPEPDYSDAQDIYESILQQFPEYERLDEVIYRLGTGLIDAGEGAQAVSYLNRLVDEYPNSKYIADAHLELGDYFFNEHMTGAAEDNYKAVLEHEDYGNYDYALYQLGWTHYNQGEHRESADRFKQVVERAEGNDTWGLLADRAADDLMLALAEVDDGWIEARDYFKDLRDMEYTYDQLEDMAGHLEGQGKDQQVIALYDWFIEERPDHPKVPDWMDGITRTLEDVDFEGYEERVVEFVDYLHPDHTWWQRNQDNDEALETAEKWVEDNLQRLGVHYHSRAQEEDGENRELYAKAAEYYQQFIDRFPDHHVSFDMTFYLGQIYQHNLERYEAAAENYQHVVDLYQEDNVPEDVEEEDLEAFVRDAAYGVVVSYNNLVREHHPESILVDMAEKAGEDPEMTAEGIDEVANDEGEPEATEEQELLEWEENFVKASDQFSEMYPTDDITPTVDYVAAEVYRDRGHYDDSIPRYENIIDNFPEHTYASFAGNSLLEANYRLKNWDEVERWARHLLENEIFDVTPEESLESAIAYAISERAAEYMEQDEQEKRLKGADELLGLAEEFPESELASGALFQSASAYSAADKVNRAAEIYQRVVDEYPESDQAPQSLVILGEIHRARTDFEAAANYFARLAEEEYRDYTVENEEEMGAADAVFNAASLREAMERWDAAIATYEEYLEIFDERIDDRQEVEYNLAYLEQDRGDYDASRERLEEYLEKYEDDVPLHEQVESYTEIARIIQRKEEDGWQEDSEEYFDRVLEIWEDADRWVEEYGEEEGEQYRHAMRHEAAEARFEKAEFIFQDFKEVELDFPPDHLAEKAEEKAGYQQDAEQRYREIIKMGTENDMGSPEWIAAASFRIGQSYRDFANALFDLPIPDGLNSQQRLEYELSVEDLAAPLEEQALESFQRALNLALQFQAYNKWSARSAAEISDLESRRYPITEQDGVDVEHNRVDFFAPEPVTQLDVVRDRGQARRERLAPDEGPIRDPDHPDYLPELDPDSEEFIPELNPSHPQHDPEQKRQFEEEHDIELDFYEENELDLYEEDEESDDDGDGEGSPATASVGSTR